MIRHDAPGKNAHGHAFLDLAKYLHEGQVVAVMVEDRTFTVGSVEHVVDETARCGS